MIFKCHCNSDTLWPRRCYHTGEPAEGHIEWMTKAITTWNLKSQQWFLLHLLLDDDLSLSAYYLKYHVLTHRKCHKNCSIFSFWMVSFINGGKKLGWNSSASLFHVLYDYGPNLDWHTCNHGFLRGAALGANLLFFFFSL